MVHGHELSAKVIMEAVWNGDFYATTGILLKQLNFSNRRRFSVEVEPETGLTYTIRFIGRNGKVLKEVQGTGAFYNPRGDELYVRVKVDASDKREAWTQPVFLEDL